MRFASVLAGLVMFCLGDLGAAGRRVLFIGNSFLFGSGSAVRIRQTGCVSNPDIDRGRPGGNQAVAH